MWVNSAYQKPNGRQADVQLLTLKTKLGRRGDADLKAVAWHDGKEVCHHQLQAVKGCPDQALATIGKQEQDTFTSKSSQSYSKLGYLNQKQFLMWQSS